MIDRFNESHKHLLANSSEFHWLSYLLFELTDIAGGLACPFGGRHIVNTTKETGPVEVDNGSGSDLAPESPGKDDSILPDQGEGVNPQQPTPLRGALAMAARGLPVIPLHNPTKTTAGIEHARCLCRKYPCGDGNKNVGKHPRIDGWKEAATTDSATIHRWAMEYPGCNFGYQLGEEFIGIDGDERKGLEQGEAELEQAGHQFSDTVTVQTGNGWHRVYASTGFDQGSSSLLLASMVALAG